MFGFSPLDHQKLLNILLVVWCAILSVIVGVHGWAINQLTDAILHFAIALKTLLAIQESVKL